jgi:Development and cell death domain
MIDKLDDNEASQLGANERTQKTYIFECSSSTYMDCIEKSLFGSNKPWPLEIKEGDYCLLHHYEIGGLLGLWKATSNGGRNLVPKIWSGKFPFQVRVKLLLPSVTEVSRKVLSDSGINPAVGRFDNCADEALAQSIIQSMLDLPK